ncbi:hypothetical protein GGR26_000596 [Lewinella marina]|uniref:Uncharacterized protein n=1 Tax=Neolewinella marina TaxID=438751 RepID=A0A2G0CJ41_9BACT|nr:hypothetical protein [Neolewinella marina]NJB84851.1 hypothetical protein [Neolewinella marina]PHK99993.1 hypothetical protein CGL56_02820 [Neolewinella marina]
MITRTQFDSLAAAQYPYCVSIFIPTYRVGKEEEDRIRYKNAVQTATQKLEKRYDLSRNEADAFLKQAHDLADNLEFWKNQSEGLAVFVAKDRFEHYVCPIDFEPMIYVSEEFYLRPLIPIVGEQHRFHFLALSKGAIKLYTATEFSISEVDLSGLVPVNMDAALMQDTTNNHLSRSGGPEGGRGSNNQVYFGRGGDPSNDVEDVKTYLDRVDKGISDYLCDDNAPLVLGGVEELIPIYQEANTYAHLYTDGYAAGNLEEENPGLIHEKAWAVIADHFDAQRERDRKLFGDNRAAGEASTSIEEIVPAAVNGRVAALWMDRNAYAYGEYTAENNGVNIMHDEHKNATELYNLAAVRAFQSGARVYNVDRDELPDDTEPLNAIFRYAVDADTTDL